MFVTYKNILYFSDNKHLLFYPPLSDVTFTSLQHFCKCFAHQGALSYDVHSQDSRDFRCMQELCAAVFS